LLRPCSLAEDGASWTRSTQPRMRKLQAWPQSANPLPSAERRKLDAAKRDLRRLFGRAD